MTNLFSFCVYLGTNTRHYGCLAQTVKRLPTMWETRVRSLGREDPLEKEMATHSSTLAWKIPWMEEYDRTVAKSRSRPNDFTLIYLLDLNL